MRATYAKMLLLRDVFQRHSLLGTSDDFAVPQEECDALIAQMLEELRNTDYKHLEKVLYRTVAHSPLHRNLTQAVPCGQVAALAGEIHAILLENVTAVVAAIIRKNSRILICQRDAGGSTSLLWEFPGGKVEPHETLKECLIRECKEELAVDIEVGKVFAETEFSDANKKMAFTFFNARIKGGQLKANVHRDIRWVAARALKDYDFCPADVSVVDELLKRSGLRGISPSHSVK